MLKLTGIQLHPAVRILIGAGLIALGLSRHGASPALFVGAALVVWGIAAVLGLAAGAGHGSSPQDRR